MAGEKHLYLVVAGGYASSAAPLGAEEWQFGIRLLAGPGGEPDAIGQIANNWDVVAANHDRTETNWRIQGNWSIEGGVNDLDPADYLNDNVMPAVEAFIETSTMLNIALQLRQVRLYPIGAPDGHVVPAPPYAQGTPVVGTWTGTLPVGGTSGGMMPPDAAAVVSLRTQQIGRRGRGRIYIPGLHVGVMETSSNRGVMTSAWCTLLAGATKTLLENLQIAVLDDGFDVRPMITGSPYVDYALINSARVGNLVDGQRRRKRSITETYVASSVDNPT